MEQAINNKIKDMVYIALFAVLITICSWISIPAIVPFTLQTFAIFITLGLLGGKRGTLSILVYIFIGSIGIPVFANFSGGLGVLLGPTGGYIIGFLFLALIYWLITTLFGNKLAISIISMFLGLLICYIFGTIWYMIESGNPISLTKALSLCVIPFIIPDLIKMLLAIILTKRLNSHVNP
ncbi:MAG: biotin transporter BioY [Eubacteriales bacterium]